jgi:hypothetical protein
MHLHYYKDNFYWFKGLNVKRIFNLISDLQISDEYITDYEHGDRRKLVIYDKDIWFLLNLYSSNYIKKLMTFYLDKSINLFPINQRFPLSLSCMTENDYGLKLHYDTTKINTNNNPRYIGCNIYLNDNYEGGELIFPFMDLKIKPESGDLITYRSDAQFPHYVKKVTQNKKWLLQGYFRPRGEHE